MSAPPLSRDRARRLRRGETDAERRLWMHLRGHQLGVLFRRQHPFGPYLLHFCCVERMLVVGLDGGQDDRGARGEGGFGWLPAQGFRVLLFPDRESLKKTEGVPKEIKNRL